MILYWWKNIWEKGIPLTWFFALLYMTITVCIEYIDLKYAQYTNTQLENQTNQMVVDEIEKLQRYEVERFLKTPQYFIAQNVWNIPHMDKQYMHDLVQKTLIFIDSTNSIESIDFIFKNHNILEIKRSKENKFTSIFSVREKDELLITEDHFDKDRKEIDHNFMRIHHRDTRENEDTPFISFQEKISLLKENHSMQKVDQVAWRVLPWEENHFISLVMPLYSVQEVFIGTIAIHLSLTELKQRFMDLFERWPQHKLYLVDNKGRILVGSHSHTEKEKKYIENYMYNRDKDHKKHVYTEDMLRKELFFYPLSESLNAPFMMVHVFTKEEKITSMKNIIILYIIFIFLIYYIFLYFLVKKPLQKITEYLAKITDFNTVEKVEKIILFRQMVDLYEAYTLIQEKISVVRCFVSQALVSFFVKKQKPFEVTSEKKHISLFVCDMAGFTKLSERMIAEDLLQYMKRYFDAFTRVVFANHGMVDQYIGDAIVALWGAYDPQANASLHTCKAVLQCVDVLYSEINTYFQQEELPDLFVSFGISTGQAFVGTLGSEDHLQYSAMGVSVWRAHYIQEANKFYHTQILIDEHTYKEIKHIFACRPVDYRVLHSDPCMLYELMGDWEKLQRKYSKEAIVLTHRAWEAYTKRHWRKAWSMYGKILKIHPEDGVSRTMRHRCETFLHTPPPLEWDGAYKE